MKAVLSLIIVMILNVSICCAQTANQIEKQIDKLDAVHQECLDEGVNMPNCATIFYSQMDSILNVVYKRLKKQMDTAEFKELKRSQVAWLKKRDSQFKEFDLEAQQNELGVDVGTTLAFNKKSFVVIERVKYLLKSLK